MGEDVSDLMSVAEAIKVIDQLPVRPRKTHVPLGESAGLRLAEDLHADRDYPPFDKSLMDGYAVRSADVPAALEVIGESAAGSALAGRLETGQAMAVMTGAPLPQGADAVVPIEQTDSNGVFAKSGQRVSIAQPVKPGGCFAARASDIRSGAIVLATGTVMRPPQIAVAACIGADPVAVWDRPRCAVLATGDELIPVDQSPGATQIRNSNNPMLVSLLARLNCATTDLGVVPDDPAKITTAIRDGLRGDVLFVIGGMSMGQYDYVPKTILELGGQFKITKLRIRPGKPLVLAAMPDGKYVVGLPGNPVSAFVCTVRLASRLLARMAGGKPNDRIQTLPLSAPAAANGPREFYQPAILEGDRVRPLAWKGSADIFTLAKADVLIIRPENAPAAAAGECVPVIRVD